MENSETRSMRIKLLASFAASLVWMGFVFAGAPSIPGISDAVLDRFSSAPATGPSEATQPSVQNWDAPAKIPTTWPGNQLAQHPFLFFGEGFNRISIVRNGQVVWNYRCGRGGEIDDAWVLSNGNVLYVRSTIAEEITPEKQVVWHYDLPAGTQSHSIQPIGLDKVLLMQNGLPPKLLLINIKTNAIEMEHVMPAISATDPKTVHTQFRHVRLTKEGTWLVNFLNLNKVVEYDKDWKELLTIQIKSPWASLRLPDGNILVSGDHYGTLNEFDRTGKLIWQITARELPGIDLRVVQGAERLANGDIVMACSPGNVKEHGSKTSAIQLVEVTPDKKVVWVLQDWRDLGGGSGVQLLDEPGVPEDGDLLR